MTHEAQNADINLGRAIKEELAAQNVTADAQGKYLLKTLQPEDKPDEHKMDEHEEPQHMPDVQHSKWIRRGYNAEEVHQADLAAAAAPPPVRLGASEPMHAHQSGLEQFRYLLIGGLAAATIAITAYQGFRLQREIARA